MLRCCAVLALTSGCWLVESGPQPSYEKVVRADAPLAYYRLGETSGMTAVDASGHHYDAMYVGPTGMGALLYGQAGAIPADSDTAVRLVNAQIYPPTGLPLWDGDFTIEAWIAPHSLPAPADHKSILIWEVYQSQGFRFEWDGAYALSFSTNETGGAGNVDSVELLRADAWNHVVVTATRIASQDTITMYLDGDLVASGTVTLIPTSLDNAYHCWGACEGVDTDADFDELALYDRALSSAQVARHYAAAAR